MAPGRIVIFGLGYSARVIARRLTAQGWDVDATGQAGTLDFDDRDAVAAALSRASHILSSIPPFPGPQAPDSPCDPVFARHGAALAEAARRGAWLSYLSSTGVYGDTGGAWVDESAPMGAGRRLARRQADTAWRGLGARIFRLPGIYGPGRSAFGPVRAGTAHRIDLPGHRFSRIHVEDLAGGVLAAMAVNAGPGVWNLADDEPAPQSAVVEEACRLLNRAPPRMQRLEEAPLSPQARAFYTENRRIANGKAKRQLAWRPRYPTYREGLAAILASCPA